MRNQPNYIAGRAQTPLGKLLADARAAKKFSRAKLAKLADVGENSIVRYEKAGLDEEGQFPPAHKLAALCFHLDISPQHAFWSSLSEQDFLAGEAAEWDDLMNHPGYCYMMRQYDVLLKRNYFLGEALKIILEIEEKHELDFPVNEVDDRWLISEIKSVVGNQAAFEHRMLLLGIAHPYDHGQASSPSKDEDAWKFEVADPQALPTEKSKYPAQRAVTSSYIRLRRTVRELEQRHPELLEINIDDSFDRFADFNFEIGSEEDLPSPPSPSTTPTTHKERKDSDD